MIGQRIKKKAVVEDGTKFKALVINENVFMGNALVTEIVRKLVILPKTTKNKSADSSVLLFSFKVKLMVAISNTPMFFIISLFKLLL